MIETIRDGKNNILVSGAHRPIIQSILDFDYVSGFLTPTIQAVVGGNKKSFKCYFGEEEILLPMYPNVEAAKKAGVSADWLLNIASANSARKMTESFFAHYKDALGAHIFAEGISERDSLTLLDTYGKSKCIVGPAGVGLLVPGALKLGGIGGIYGNNINIFGRNTGDTAIVCSSGGMVNELIDNVLRAGGSLSFAACYGGDRFPVTTPLEWCLEAERDPKTAQICYFGELGGYDEYEIAVAITAGNITKPFHAYIAGRYDTGESAVQFGHAKALAKTPEEDAFSKMKALKESGAAVYDSFAEFVQALKDIEYTTESIGAARSWEAPLIKREHSLFTAVRDRGSQADPFVRHALSTLLEKEEVSEALTAFTEEVYSLLIDHGAQPSGAVNTMITTRAGRDMGTSLASGLLTVGDRFGGAINGAARTWRDGVMNETPVEALLESFKSKGEYVPGIGHRKYTIHTPDPRVRTLLASAKKYLTNARHTSYAESVAKRTSQKRANLILNVDGAVAAIVLDILSEIEDMSDIEIDELIEIEFFNSYFLIPRTVGFIGNFLSQKRRDEGLFRLPDGDVYYE